MDISQDMTHYIYIPGFGDRFDVLRRLALRRQDVPGVQTTLVPMHWSDRAEVYEQKYERIARTISSSNSDEIVLVGESAGGAMALYAFSRQHTRVKYVTTLCGYNHGAEDIVQFQRRRHPAFYPLLLDLDEIVSNLPVPMRQRITTIYSLRDRVVEPRHSRIQGVRAVELSTPGHLFSIGYVLAKRTQLIFSSTRYNTDISNR